MDVTEANTSLEDGEILDEIAYTPLERPADYAAQAGALPVVPEMYRDGSEKEESVSDSDSSSKSNSIKKLKLMKKLKPQKSHRYDIWSRRLLDETLAQTLTSCDVTHRDRSRNVESYDYTLSYGYKEMKTKKWLDRKHDKKFSSDEEQEKRLDKRGNNKRTLDDRKDVKLRLVQHKSKERKVNIKPRILQDLNYSETSEDADIAIDIANKLFEENEKLIVRVVEVLGRERAANIFKEVKRIEANGGMLIMNQSRRRTPGGVYIFLVKHDDDITKEQMEIIFEEEKEKMKENSKMKKKLKHKEMKEKVKNSDKNVPQLLNKAELLLKLNKTKTENTISDQDDVSNPPPTPETDVQIDSNESNDVQQKDERKVESYDDDFLDINEVVDMETF